MTMLRCGVFQTRDEFVRWASDLAKAEQRGQFVGRVGIGAQLFGNAQEFSAWASNLADDAWSRLADLWVKFEQPSPKQS